MPFDPAPQEVKIGRFQQFADALLRGCQMRPRQCVGTFHDGRDASCAVGALSDGMACMTGFYLSEDLNELLRTYRLRYGASIMMDNDYHHLTREEIAARIAAL